MSLTQSLLRSMNPVIVIIISWQGGLKLKFEEKLIRNNRIWFLSVFFYFDGSGKWMAFHGGVTFFLTTMSFSQ